MQHDDRDSIIMDEPDRCMPKFLAPEVVADEFEYAYHLPLAFLPLPHRSSSSVPDAGEQQQPLIRKAINI